MALPEQAAFLRAATRLLLTMTAHNLPVPLAISWRGWVATPHLSVQVQADDYAPWLHALDNPSQETEHHGDELHVHALGQLPTYPDTQLHLVAVTKLEAVAAT